MLQNSRDPYKQLHQEVLLLMIPSSKLFVPIDQDLNWLTFKDITRKPIKKDEIPPDVEGDCDYIRAVNDIEFKLNLKEIFICTLQEGRDYRTIEKTSKKMKMKIAT